MCIRDRFYNVVRPNVRLPLLTGALWLLSGFIVGGALPSLLQRYVVEPNELSLETPYICLLYTSRCV